MHTKSLSGGDMCAAVSIETYVKKQLGPALECTWEATCCSLRIKEGHMGKYLIQQQQLLLLLLLLLVV
jgi:hypothetical protein